MPHLDIEALLTKCVRLHIDASSKGPGDGE